MKNRRIIALLFCAAVALIYLSLSPGSIAGMGYMAEEMNATDALLSVAGSTVSGKSAPRIEWPRNGVVDLFFHVPFIVVSNAAFPGSFHWKDRLLSVEPIILTALLLTVVFLWLAEITRSWSRSLVLSLILGFCTLVWPYAYIGLEALQSFALISTGYLALQSSESRGFGHLALFALAAAVTISAKSTGAFLLPVVVFLMWCNFESSLRNVASRHRTLAEIALTLTIVGAVFLANAYVRSFFWAIYGGSRSFIKFWLIQDPASFLINVVGFFGSPNKGLLVFAPVCLLALYGLPRAFASRPRLVWFAILTLGGLVGGFSLLRNWSDETWGPRYLHSAVAPLLLCYAAAVADQRTMRRWRAAPLAAAAVIGLTISFLGALFYYGSLYMVIGKTAQSTLEALQFDPIWNHYRFNARLLSIWGSSLGEVPKPFMWTPDHQWFFVKPEGVPAWISIDLSPYAKPQASMIREWSHRGFRVIYLASGIIGAALMVWTLVLVRRTDSVSGSALGGGNGRR